MANNVSKVKATTSQLATALLQLKGKPLEFSKYKPFELIYDVDPPIIVGKAGRQIGKSVGIGAITVLKGIARPYFNSLYIAPLSQQTQRFSKFYLDMFIESPLIKKYFKDQGSVKNVFEKSFSSGSRVYLSYAQEEADADRIRGISADSLTVDEVQDISIDALPAIFETMSGSDFGYKRLFGTSKSTSGTLEAYWLKSNQMEWVVKCKHCGKHNVPADYEACWKICENLKGPQCMYCFKLLDVNSGIWVPFNTHTKQIYGFHLPQFMMSANTSEKRWSDMHMKINSGIYTPVKIANEVFGLATDLAGKAISQKEAHACCNPLKTEFDKTWERDSRGIINVVVGVDWSVTGGTKSFTVVSVLGFDALGKCYLMYAQKMQGIHITEQVDRVVGLARTFNASVIASDRGVGQLQAEMMRASFGADKVVPVQYVHAKVRLRWDYQGAFLAADRTQAIDNVLMKIRSGIERFETPAMSTTEPFWKDALAIFEEETLAGSRVYRHAEDEPDDWIHSIVFANIGYQYLTGDYTFLE